MPYRTEKKVLLLLIKRLTAQRAALLILAAGCVLRVGYGLIFGAGTNQHDLYFNMADPSESSGHAAYILHIFEHWTLPDISADWQFYHPPFHHFLAAVFLKINTWMGFSFARAVENLQFLTAGYSCLSLYVWYRIFRVIGLDGRALLIALAIPACHPAFYLIGGSLNNDCLMWLFVDITIFYLIKWTKTPSVKNILILALSLGLGMMTKLTAVTLAPVIAAVFLHRLITRKDKKRLLAQFAGFGLVSVPLGVWYSLRGLFKYDLPLGYVPMLSTDADQYLGDIGAFKRIVPLDFSTLFKSPFVIWKKGDYNLFIKVAKTSFFGEHSPRTAYPGHFLPYLLSFLGYAIILMSLAALIYAAVCAFRGRGGAKPMKLVPSVPENAPALLGIYFTFIVSLIFFALKHPFQCTLDIRYCLINIPIAGAFLGWLAGNLGVKKSPADGRGQAAALAGEFAWILIAFAVAAFCAMSAVLLFMDSIT